MSGVTFEAPGKGSWELEAVHMARPVSRFGQAAMARGMPKGFAEGTARYGLLLEAIEPAFVRGFTYMRMRPFGAPPDAKGPPPKFIFQLLTRLLPSMRKRIRTSKEAFERKLWREDLRRWDEVDRPAAVKSHRAVQSVDPRTLDDEGLCKHLARCAEHAEFGVTLHHRYTVSCILPVGDLIAHVQEWTGKGVGEILQIMRGSSKVSLGVAAEELGALAAALRADADAGKLLDGTDAAKVLDGLKAREGAVGDATRAYLEMVGFRCLGYDVGSKYALEMPEMLVRAIKAAVSGEANKDSEEKAKARVGALRDEVPEAHRARFDELVEEARFINRLRDERGHYSDGWATGLARRAVLEAGRRLAEKGALEHAEHAVDATPEELAGLVRGAKSPTAAEIGEHVKWRTSKTVADPDVPPFLGNKPGEPPPVDWLPPDGRRAQRAVGCFLTSMFGETSVNRSGQTLKGLPVSPGVYEGVARLVKDEGDFGRIQQGDILVTRNTSPYFNVVLPLLGAIVTDRGGQLSHAAIVSREYGIPGVVSTVEGTKLIKDGARVRVNGTTGEVQLLA